MSTAIRPELSKNNPYYISRNRYYELKHFCLQYNEWKNALKDISQTLSNGIIELKHDDNDPPNPVERIIFLREKYICRIEMVDKVVSEFGYLSEGLKKALTEGVSYEKLKIFGLAPCCKEVWYAAYHKCFWILDRLRN